MTKENFQEQKVKKLKQVQEARKNDTLKRVNEAIAILKKSGSKINFPNVARQANVSVSYLYKYPEVKQYIAQLRNQGSSIPRQINANSSVSSTQTKIIDRLKKRIRQLEEEKTDLKRKNEALAGQVYRVHYLQEQIARQEQTIQDLNARLETLHTDTSSSSLLGNTPVTHAESHSVSDLISQEVEQSGVPLTETLKRVIYQYDATRVLLAIKAYNQYKETQKIDNPGACLRRAIEHGWTPKETSIQQSSVESEFDQFYADAVSDGFLLDVPKNHLAVEQGEWVVKINRHSVYGPWTPLNWRDAKLEYEQTYLSK